MDPWTQRRETWEGQDDDTRGPFEIDYARIVHSASFRRLQGKTQVLNIGDSDFYRTRLTHSLEVAQIAGGIATFFREHLANTSHPAHEYLPDKNLIQTIGFSHDLGHPPFGHGGEVALNYCMRKNGGFEGNGQTLRILSRLEQFSKNNGSNLTRRTLLGVLKYPVAFSTAKNWTLKPALNKQTTAIKIIDRNNSKPPKCYLDTEKDVVEWIFETFDKNDRKKFQEVDKPKGKHKKSKHKSFDCSIMDVADDIAFGVHDFEDALTLRIIDEHDFREFVTEDKCSHFLDKIVDRYSEKKKMGSDYELLIKNLFHNDGNRKRHISRLVHYFITNCRVMELDGFKEPLLKFRTHLTKEAQTFLEALEMLVLNRVITSAEVQHLEFKGQKMVVSVFEALSSEPDKFLPRDIYKKFKDSKEDPRIICDHISGMTDLSLLKTYDRLFSPRMGSVFDRL